MKKFIFLLLMTFITSVIGQNKITVLVENSDDRQPLIGANVYFDSLQIGASTDANGRAFIDQIPNGQHTLIVSYIGFQTKKLVLDFPRKDQQQLLTVLLEPAPFSSKQIVVTSTRNNSVLEKTPVRIQVLGKEEVNEEIGILPGNISKFLGESSSIITQQTSVASGAVSFRLQGLPARYTQLLKDGFPDFSGLASGFSPLQIPPLDLQQIEITRGSYSTLFANNAVAGIVNLISRKPTKKPQLDVLFNRTNRQGKDISSFYSAQYGKTGLTLLASQSLQNAVDVDDDDFSDLPQFRQTTINPRLFYDFDETTSLMIGLTSFFENRSGGDMHVLKNGIDSAHVYSEKYATKRLGLNLHFQKRWSDSASITFKSSFQNFNQTATFPTTYFNGQQNYTFAEASYFRPFKHHKPVAGISITHQNFKQQNEMFSRLYDNRSTTVGVFAQDDWTFMSRWTLHGGLRWDYRSDRRSFLLPHAALLFNARQNLKLRLSGGFGYSVPALYDLAPDKAYYTYQIDSLINLHAERSRDLSFDATWRFHQGELALSLNQVFYVTWIDNAQFSSSHTDLAPLHFFSAPLSAKGAETHMILNLDEAELFVDYNYLDVRRNLDGNKENLPFTPHHKLNLTATYEQEGSWRTGVEGFYTGEQLISNGEKGRSYFIMGLMFEKKFKYFSLIFNVENLFDKRQSKYEKTVYITNGAPQFKEIYMPLEGRVANLALWFQF